MVLKVADMSDKAVARDSVRVAKEETLSRPSPSIILPPPPASAFASSVTPASDPSRQVTRWQMKSTDRPSIHRATHRSLSPHVGETTPMRLTVNASMDRALSPSETTGSPVRASVNVASGHTNVTGRSPPDSSPRVSFRPEPTNARMTALEHGMDETREAFHQLTEHVFHPPVHPDMAPASPVVDLPAVHAPQPGEFDTDSNDSLFHDEILTSVVSPTSSVSTKSSRAAQCAFDSMSEHNVDSFLPLSIRLTGTSDGIIPPRCGRRMHAAEALMRIHHLDTDPDSEPTRSHAAVPHTHVD